MEGMNIGTGGDSRRSGEEYAIARAVLGKENPVVFDIGAQGGDYTKEVQTINSSAQVYLFEPEPAEFQHLKTAGFRNVFPLAFGDHAGTVTLYSVPAIKGFSSVYRRDGRFTAKDEVALETIDHFCKQQGIEKIDLLKLDVEGSEYSCLLGAKDMIEQGRITHIQFEFGLAAKGAKVYFSDIFDLLSPHYGIYRIMRNGLLEIAESSKIEELLFTTNYLAIGKNNT